MNGTDTLGSAPSPSQQEGRALFAERARIQRLERIRQLVFGSLDGLLVPLGVIRGVAAGTSDTKAVLVAGLAEAFAGALSMGAGEFISGRSEAQVQRAEVAKEMKAIHEYPEFEFQEMIELFEHEGVSKEDATRISEILQNYQQSYNKTMVEKELGI